MEHINQVYLGIFFIFIIFAVKIAREGMAEIAKHKTHLLAHQTTHASFLQKIDEQEQTLQALLLQKETLENEFKDASTNEKSLRQKVAQLNKEMAGKNKTKTKAALKRLHGV